MTRTDFGSILPEDFLVKVDRASMANSLEIRSPFWITDWWSLPSLVFPAVGKFLAVKPG